MLGEDESWIEHATAMEFDSITPEEHPGNYLLAVAYYAVWLAVQAHVGSDVFRAAAWQEKDGGSAGSPGHVGGPRCSGGFLLATIVYANTMEMLGNRELNDSMHNVHS